MINPRNICNATPAANAIHGPREANGIDDIIAAKQAAANSRQPRKLAPLNPRYICKSS